MVNKNLNPTKFIYKILWTEFCGQLIQKFKASFHVAVVSHNHSTSHTNVSQTPLSNIGLNNMFPKDQSPILTATLCAMLPPELSPLTNPCKKFTTLRNFTRDKPLQIHLGLPELEV